ncbi:hypothetical protein BJV74DRAFT_796432 [Russula compacta]|nr:hypothetical protein BJV74DRAFT_796432 [Russula compacta]
MLEREASRGLDRVYLWLSGIGKDNRVATVCSGAADYRERSHRLGIHLMPLPLTKGDRDAHQREQSALAGNKETTGSLKDWEVRVIPPLGASDGWLLADGICRVGTLQQNGKVIRKAPAMRLDGMRGWEHEKGGRERNGLAPGRAPPGDGKQQKGKVTKEGALLLGVTRFDGMRGHGETVEL